MAFSITKIGDVPEIVDEFWKAYKEGERIQSECPHVKSNVWNTKDDRIKIHVCDDCHKIWHTDTKTS